MKPESVEWIKKMQAGDRRALARLMTFVDNRHEDIIEIMSEIHKHTGKANRIGITGPPGAGKSTLTDKLIAKYRQQGKKVGVVCIDPSSPFTGGAVLGDRIRMMDHAADDGVFIRSLGSRGSHGGLSRATRDVVSLLDAFGFDVILIETVGVGQTELDIMSVAHAVVVVLVPESGDTIQTMKAGLMEIADLFVVNKADREGADRIFAELKGLAELFSDKGCVEVYKTQAFKGIGVTELIEGIDKHIASVRLSLADPKKLAALLREECNDIILAEVHNRFEQAFQQNSDFKKIEETLLQNKNPYEAASAILQRLTIK